jgi:cyclin H
MDTAQDLYNTAMDHVRASRLTDVELIYTPPQISLACLHMVLPDLAEKWAQEKGMYSELLVNTLRHIAQIIQQDGLGPNVEVVRQVDRRLKLCMNPEKIVGTKACVALSENVRRFC